jgi:hypothetical protein
VTAADTTITQVWPGKYHSIPGEQVRAIVMPDDTVSISATNEFGQRASAFLSLASGRELGQWLLDNCKEERS